MKTRKNEAAQINKQIILVAIVVKEKRKEIEKISLCNLNQCRCSRDLERCLDEDFS